MDWRWDPAGLAMLACGAVMVGLAAYVWPRRAAGGLALVAMLAALAQWSIAYGLELSVVPVAGKEVFGAAKYAGIGALAPAWIAFALRYIGRDRYLTKRVLALLMIEPLVTLALLANPGTHDLVRYYPPEAATQQYPVVGVGWFFWVHLVYTDTLLLAATGVFVVSLARVSRVYWRVAAALIAAALLPWVVNLLHNLDVAGLGRIDLTPAAFAVTAVVIVWGVFRRRLLGLSTIGRSVVVETMRDGVIVVDVYGRVVDLNQAAARIVGRPGDRVVGTEFAQVLPDLAVPVADQGDLGETTLRLRVDPTGGIRDYEVTRGALRDSQGRCTGELMLFRDVTERVRAEHQLRALLAERSRIARVLQDSLLPATLPRVRGLDLAARYRPAGDGSDLGGDFYDVFPLDDGRWALVLGDVSGKGADAAAITALARYTVRALAAEPHTPREMLARLNDAVARQTTDERYCTAVYVILEPHSAGARVRLALGGHPPPLLVRDGHGVEYVGCPGLVLGVIPEPELHDVTFDIGAGEVLCLYTDGVTEARRGREFFGENRLARCLTPTAHLPADEIAGRLEMQVECFSDTGVRDDIAIVVVKPTGGPECSARVVSS
jgi:PAS domain S-box-containing protein